MEFTSREDVILFLKNCSENTLRDILSECITYPNHKVIGDTVLHTYKYDGSQDSFATAVSKLKCDNKVLQSPEMEWIRYLLEFLSTYYIAYDLGELTGVAVYKHQLPFVFIQSENEQSSKILRVSYDALRNIIGEIQRTTGKLECRHSKVSTPTPVVKCGSWAGVLFGFAVGVCSIHVARELLCCDGKITWDLHKQ